MNPIPMEVTAAYAGLGMITIVVALVTVTALYCLFCRKCCND